FAEKFTNVVGFDENEEKINLLKNCSCNDRLLGEDTPDVSKLLLTNSIGDIKNADFYIVAVPTPINSAHVPNLACVVKASETIGRVMCKGAIICYESTVYPGVTEEICGPILEKFSGLKRGMDFKIGYSPERINPGDKKNTLENIVKIVSAEDNETRKNLSCLYGAIIKAGIHNVPSIKIAEASKIVENAQRDMNIALMNELALIFDRMNISTHDVLEAACTKWNFMPFQPGLVGGHCIGVDPYYLTYKSEELGYIPQVLHAGRRINDNMGRFIAQKTIKLLCKNGYHSPLRVGILGITFKEDIPDIRNSKVVDIVYELLDYGIDVIVHDPVADHDEVKKEYGVTINDWSNFLDLDAMILAVAHDEYKVKGLSEILKCLKSGNAIFVDVKSLFIREAREKRLLNYWSL
ncbi:nucleotide sugar dehydrogenase, partial [Synergistaceae bacterium OttesenSCG-928-I11]|nr:nucleotide sugar dehydrogenase [Synergistaceae bacterium OttesenSCG-928-I11]